MRARTRRQRSPPLPPRPPSMHSALSLSRLPTNPTKPTTMALASSDHSLFYRVNYVLLLMRPPFSRPLYP